MTADVRAVARPELGRCLYGRGSATGGCSCPRYKKVRGAKTVCTCGHSDHWHDLRGVKAGLVSASDVADAFARFRTRMAEELRELEDAVLRGAERQVAGNGVSSAALGGEQAAGSGASSTWIGGRAIEGFRIESVLPLAGEKSLPRSGSTPSSPSPAALALASALAAHGPCDRATLLVRAVYSGKTKNVQQALAWLEKTGWVTRVKDGLVLDARFASGFHPLEAVPLGAPLREAWCAKPSLDHAAVVVLRTLAAEDKDMSRGEVADATTLYGGPEGGYSLATKNFQQALARLRSLGLARYDAGGKTFRVHPDLVDMRGDAT